MRQAFYNFLTIMVVFVAIFGLVVGVNKYKDLKDSDDRVIERVADLESQVDSLSAIQVETTFDVVSAIQYLVTKTEASTEDLEKYMQARRKKASEQPPVEREEAPITPAEYQEFQKWKASQGQSR